jgi:hypothetical protein
MLTRRTHKLKICGRALRCGLVLLLLVNPAESEAFFGLFRRCTTPPPPVAAYSPCSPPVQTVSYVPQTCYRTVTVNVPVTTYRPVTSCSPCTGRTTALQPVTVMMPQQRMIPYTTFRYVVTSAYVAPAMAAPVSYAPVPAPVAYAPPACMNGCGGAPSTYSAARPYYQPSAPASYPVQSYPGGYAPTGGTPPPTFGTSNYGDPNVGAASSGIPSNGVLTYGAPAPGTSTYYGGAPNATTPNGYTPNGSVPNGYVPNGAAPSGAVLNGTIINGNGQPMAPSTPAASPMQSYPPMRTFQDQPAQTPTNPMPPIPDHGTSTTPGAAPISAPGLIDPSSRTTSWPAERRSTVSPVSWPETSVRSVPTTVSSSVAQPVMPSQPQVDKDGWRPSMR